MRLSTPMTVALALALLLGALSAVAWRQGRARDVVSERERLLREIALELEERTDLEQNLQQLGSRRRVVPEAAERLGLRPARDHEIVLLPWDAR